MWADRAKTVREQGTEAIVDGTLRALVHRGLPREATTSATLREMFVGIDDEGYASCCRIIEQMDLTDGLPNITRADAGDRRRAGPGHAARRARRGDRRRRSRGARLEVLDPGAHLINVERPDDVTDLILEHLATETTPATRPA